MDLATIVTLISEHGPLVMVTGLFIWMYISEKNKSSAKDQKFVDALGAQAEGNIAHAKAQSDISSAMTAVKDELARQTMTTATLRTEMQQLNRESTALFQVNTDRLIDAINRPKGP